jgi:putative membrane protein
MLISKLPRLLSRPATYVRCFSASPSGAAQPSEASTSPTLAVYIKPAFYVPKAERGQRDTFLLEGNDATLGERRLKRGDRLCPTRELNFTATNWRKHKSPYRKLRHLWNTFRSSPFQRVLFPDLFVVASIGAGVTYYNEFVACSETLAQMSSEGFAGATTAIAILAGFRLNASYGRYEESRIFWGDTNNTIRDLAGQTMMWMKDSNQRARMLKLCKAYPVALMFHLNEKGCHHSMKRAVPATPNFKDRVQAEFEAELSDIYSDGKDMADFRRISQAKYRGANTPLDVLTCMRETIAGSVGTVDAIYVRGMDEQCQRLCASFGASERVLRTPLPTGFTRHSSRLLAIWSSTLPFALYPAMGPWLTVPTVIITTYAVLGIEDLGVQLEEPFDILPLRQYSDGMFDSVGQIERNYTSYLIDGDGEVKEPKQ